MPYKFKSRATADLIMLDTSARKLLAIVGKDADGPGIITAMQIPGAPPLATPRTMPMPRRAMKAMHPRVPPTA
jgi:hypothetical protein